MDAGQNHVGHDFFRQGPDHRRARPAHKVGRHLQVVATILFGQRRLNAAGKLHFGIIRRRCADVLKIVQQDLPQNLVGNVIRAGFFKDHFTFRLGHQRRALGNLANSFVDFLDLRHLRRPHQIQNFRFRLHHIRRYAARIGHGVMNARLLNHMLPQIIDTHVHQFHRIERAAAQMRRRPGMRALAVEFEGDLIVRQRAHRKNRVVGHRMPGQSNIRASEDSFPRHERFS